MGPFDANLPYTVATFTFLQRRAGARVLDPATESACAAVAALEEGAAAAERLLEAVTALGGEATPDGIAGTLGKLFGGAVQVDFAQAPDREGRLARVRRATFGDNRPWIAGIADRARDGQLGVHWVLVEGMGEVVRLLDPTPWDDQDDERSLPLADFVVLWELAGGHAFRLG